VPSSGFGKATIEQVDDSLAQDSSAQDSLDRVD
jgi:hypothetical protein